MTNLECSNLLKKQATFREESDLFFRPFFPLIFQNHHNLLELAPFALLPVAGCHRASPSTTLDKRYIYEIGFMIMQFHKHVNTFSKKIQYIRN